MPLPWKDYFRISLLFLALASMLWAGTEYPALPGQPVVPNQLLVRYKSGTASVSVTSTMVPGAQAVALPDIPNVYLVQVPPGAPQNYSTQLSLNPLVDYVEPNRIRHTTVSAPNDPYYSSPPPFLTQSQWALPKVQALQAWQLIPNVYLTSGTAGAGRIKVAVIDTGADCTHPDFANAGGSSRDAASGGQIVFLLSQAMVGTTVNNPSCAWQDDYGHGTHVSGIIAAAANNGRDIAGLGYPLELIEYKVLDNTGSGTDADIASAIRAAANVGANVISMSLGEATYSQTLQDAITYAWQRNCVVVAAAGNDAAPEIFFPADANHAIGVAATGSSDARASFSNTGSGVDIAAPGVGIISTAPMYSVPLTTNLEYDQLDGTSQAAPHVAAVAGLIEMASPNLGPMAVAQRIQQSADGTDNVSNGGWDSNEGYGRINAYRAISGSLRSASVGGITGQVVNTSGLPVASPTISVNGAVKSGAADSNGLFRVSNLVSGNTYTVNASAASLSANVSVAVVAGADTNVTIMLGATTGVFQGTVSDGGVPIAGAVVEALSSGLIQAEAATDASGKYSLTVPPGTYNLQAATMYGVTTTVTSQSVGASGNTTVDIAMAKEGAISGTVLDSSNNPVANAVITITGAGFSAGAIANAGGNFSTIGLPAGTYTVTATRASPAFTGTVSGVVVTNDQVTMVNFSQNVTVTTSPPGLQIIVDGTTLTAPQFFNWTAGSQHTVNVASPQNTANTHATFSSWSDSGAQSHTVTAPAAGQTATFTANFSSSYLLTLAASPANGGTVAANPTSADGFYASGTPVQVTATANSGFTFSTFSGDLTGSTNPQTVAMSAPRTVTANFSSPTAMTVTTNPVGRSITVDGTTYTSPQTFNWASGSMHTLAVASPQSGAAGTRYVFATWSDGLAITHQITAPATATTYTANFTTQYLLTFAASPSGGGTLAANPTSTDGYYNSGTSVQVTATANPGFLFGNFSGDLTGTGNPQSVVMSAPRSVTGNFTGVVTATVTTNPPGLRFQVDGITYPVSQTFSSWAPGSQHTLAILTNPQSGGTGTRYRWVSWSDNLPMSHGITAPAAGTAITYTATFNPEYLLTLAASPIGGGVVVANPNSPTGDGYYASGTSVQLTAAANGGFQFANFAGDLTGPANPQSVTMSAPHAVTAIFSSGTSSGPLAGYWPLNEPFSATLFGDYSGNGNTGTCPSGSCPAMGVAGKAGTAANFNGTSNQITIPDSPALRLNQLSIVLWVYPTRVGNNYQTLVAKEDGSGGHRNYGLYIAPNIMQVRYAVWAGDCATKFAANSTGQLTLNAWNHIAFTYDGTMERFYLNGALDSSTAAPAASLCQAAVPVNIGKETSAFQPFSGVIDDVRIYNQPLTSASVSSLYSPLAAYWKLDEAFGIKSFSDASGNLNTGGCSGSACPTMGIGGKLGTAASFNGVNSQITIPDSASLRLNQFTIGLWIYPKQVKAGYQPLLVKEDVSGNNRNYGLYIVPNTMQVRYAIWANDCATKFAANSAGSLVLNAWNYVVFTYDGATESLYINGALDSSTPAVTAALCQASVPVSIGKEASAFLPFNGVLDDIRIYSQPLTAAGVASLYSSF